MRTRASRAPSRWATRAKFAGEFEFFLFSETPASLHEKGFQKLEPLSPGMFGYSWVREGQNGALMRAILDGMRAFDIEIEGLHTETGPGVYEVAHPLRRCLRAADKAALFKTAMKQIALDHGLVGHLHGQVERRAAGLVGPHAPEPLAGRQERLRRARASPTGSPRRCATTLAGQVELMPELTALYSPTINSYKRYVPGVWAPLTATWGVENRTCAIRVIGAGDANATRVEYRQTAADINPYIAMATCLAAGLYGIEHELEPPPPASGDASDGRRSAQAAAAHARRGDRSSSHASKAAREILGAAVRRSLRAHARLGGAPVRARGDATGSFAAISKRSDAVSGILRFISKLSDTSERTIVRRLNCRRALPKTCFSVHNQPMARWCVRR